MTDLAQELPRPPAPRPLEMPLGPIATMRVLGKNPIETWTKWHFEWPIVIGPTDMPRPDLVSLDDLKPRIEGRASAVVAALVDIDLQPYMASMNAFASEALRFGGRQFGAHIATELGVAQVKKALAELQAAFA